MSPKPITRNTLFYGDNLPILREHIPTEIIDLVYLDPPFNSNRSYNVLFKDESGISSEAQLTAFDDTWHWGQMTEETYQELVTNAPNQIAQMISALRDFIGTNQMMAYLVMMTARLVELQRVLKPTGSLYLHCDPTASHYLKMILDTVFGPQNFRNEIVWKRTSGHNDAVGYGSVHDTILFYTRSGSSVWNDVYQPYEEKYTDDYYRYQDPDGRRWMSDNLSAAGLSGGGYEYEWKGITRLWRCPKETMERLDKEGKIFYTKNGIARRKRYLDEAKGLLAQDIWADLEPLRSWHNERLGYPTQKPLALLERIIQASSNEGDVVLDPFCGCGTAIAAAQKLNRKWIGIDITHLAIALQKYRMKDMFGLTARDDYDIIGEPVSVDSARQLASEDRYQFQWWALSLVKAKPIGGDKESKAGKKGADQGIDGVINFVDDPKGKLSSVMVQVKSGKVKAGDIRDLRGTVEREGAAIGVFITLESPSSDMAKEAITAGFYHSDVWNQNYPKIQILTVEQLLEGNTIQMPPTMGTFKQAPKVKKDEGKQTKLGL
jgi:site-specific DNA-methyltransferase (adenine-specific)